PSGRGSMRPFQKKSASGDGGGSGQPPGGGGFRSWTFPLVLLGTFVLWNFLAQSAKTSGEVPYSDFYQAVTEDRVESVEITGSKVDGIYKSSGTGVGESKSFTTSLPPLSDDKL